MIHKNRVERTLEFQVQGYSSTIPQWYWKDIIATKGPLPDDRLVSIFDSEKEDKVWDDDSIPGMLHCVMIRVKRWDIESDEEYFQRMQNLEKQSKQIEERERLEYLRLKAKFEL